MEKEKNFGMLVAVREIKAKTHDGRHNLWLCRCICGKKINVSPYDLEAGNITSCGCLRKGEVARYGNLTVLKSTGINKNSLRFYKCRCDCGKIKNVAAAHLRSGNTVSCGCKRGPEKKNPGKKYPWKKKASHPTDWRHRVDRHKNRWPKGPVNYKKVAESIARNIFPDFFRYGGGAECSAVIEDIVYKAEHRLKLKKPDPLGIVRFQRMAYKNLLAAAQANGHGPEKDFDPEKESPEDK